MPKYLQKDTYAVDIVWIEDIEHTNPSDIVDAIADGAVTKNPLNYIENDHFSDTASPSDEHQIIHNHDAMIEVRSLGPLAAEGKEERDEYFRNLITESEEPTEPEELEEPKE